MQAKDVIEKLGLLPLEPDGGFFAETYKSPDKMVTEGGRERSLASAIYYLITPKSFSRFHRLKHTEIYHFYGGATADLTLIFPDGIWKTVRLGGNFLAGETPQFVVPPFTWQAVTIASQEKWDWSLLGTTMAPGFDFADFEMAVRQNLLEEYPSYQQQILELTGD